MATQMTGRASCEFVEGDIIEIVSADEYDSHRAKLRASLSWLISKVYNSQVPNDLKDPFYENSEGQLVLRPVVVNLLSSSELYCQACSNMFPETHTQWRGFWSIIQVLSRKGIYIEDVQDTAVTETVLVQTAPFKLKAHLSLMDALMRAYICEVTSVEKVVKAVRKITAFPASSELPDSPDEALMFWINKIGVSLGTEGVSASTQLLEGESHQKVRVINKTNKEPVDIPPIQDLMRDIGDGCHVAAVIIYYKPEQLNINDICLKESIGIADSLHNLRQIGQFCRTHLPWQCFHLSYEDLLYTHERMHVNILTFLADLFYCFEGPGAQILNGNETVTELKRIEAMPAAGRRSSPIVANVPISSATKKSFHKSFEDTANNLGLNRGPAVSPGSHQPLLPKRAGNRRSGGQHSDGWDQGMAVSPPPSRGERNRRRVQSLSSPQERDVIRGSVLAWQDDQRISQRHETSGRLLANVSIDLEIDRSLNADTSLSLDFNELDTPRQGINPNHTDDMELESVTSGQPSRFTTPHQSSPLVGQSVDQQTSSSHDQGHLVRPEPLMPATLRPTKEREMSVSKAEERGDRTSRKKKSSPTEPQGPSLVSSSGHVVPSSLNGCQSLSADDDVISSNSSSTGTCVTPLPPGESQSPRYTERQGQVTERQVTECPFDAFVVEAVSSNNVLAPQSSELTPPTSARSAANSVAESYTVEDRATSAQAARAAGIPVVSEEEMPPSARSIVQDTRLSREGSVGSSGDFSDHESHKIHQDHKVRESGFIPITNGKIPETCFDVNNSSGYRIMPNMVKSADHLIDFQSGRGDSIIGKMTKSPSGGLTTNFAELKRIKDEFGPNIDKMDNSALIYMQSGGQHGHNPLDKGQSPRSGLLLKQNQGQQQAQNTGMMRGNTSILQNNAVNDTTHNNSSNGDGGATTGGSELSQLRLKLEQKRKEIERKKHRAEAQQNKMRQRLGKAAFMRVVSKHLDNDDGSEDTTGPDGQSTQNQPAYNTMQADLQARLGQPGPRLPLSQPTRGPCQQILPTPMTNQGSASTLPANLSAQRFTDWRTQTLSKGGQSGDGRGSRESSPGTIHRQGSLQQQHFQHQPFVLPNRGASGDGGGNPSEAGSDSSGSSQSLSNKAFSREGIQQTIDNVKNKWFQNDNDLITVGGGGEEDGDISNGAAYSARTDGYSARPSTGSTHLSGGERLTPERSSHSNINPTSFQHIPPRESSASPQSKTDTDAETYQEYDSSLDKLNNSLTELQGEIMRLSLQHEQLKASQSPQGDTDMSDTRISDALAAIGSSPGVGAAPINTRPIHGIPLQAPYQQAAKLRQQQSSSPSQSHQVPYNPQPKAFPVVQPTQQPQTSDQTQTHDSNTKPNTSSNNEVTPENTEGGFFISFGEDATPKRAKPKLTDRRGVSPSPQSRQQNPQGVSSVAQVISDANVVPGQVVDPLIPQGGESGASPPGLGFVIKETKEQAAAANKQAGEDEMLKKKQKLIEMQKKKKRGPGKKATRKGG